MVTFVRRLHRPGGRGDPAARDGRDHAALHRQERRRARPDRSGVLGQLQDAADFDREGRRPHRARARRRGRRARRPRRRLRRQHGVAGGPGGRVDVSEPVRGADPPRLERRRPRKLLPARTCCALSRRRRRSPSASPSRSGLRTRLLRWLAAGNSGSIAAARSPTSSRAGPTARWSRTSCCRKIPERYRDAAVHGIRELLGRRATQPIPAGAIDAVQDGHDGRDQRAAGAQGRAHGCW